MYLNKNRLPVEVPLAESSELSAKTAVERMRYRSRLCSPAQSVFCGRTRFPPVFVQFVPFSALFVQMQPQCNALAMCNRLEKRKNFTKKAGVEAGQQNRFERGERALASEVRFLLRSTAGFAWPAATVAFLVRPQFYSPADSLGKNYNAFALH